MAPAVGLLHPGEMGAAVGACLRQRGVPVYWTSEGRGDTTRQRAEAADLTDAGSLASLLDRCVVVFSVCPPHAAVDVAEQCAGFAGVYVDANAVAPDTARQVAGLVEPRATFVDGGIVGPPPTTAGTTRLFLSGTAAGQVAELFAGTPVDVRVVGDQVGAASAVKMAYAAWTKGSAALLLTVSALARAEGVESALTEEWTTSLPRLPDRLASAERSAAAKGWRWTGEMAEIAAAMRAAGLPDGFHTAAEEVYRRHPRLP